MATAVPSSSSSSSPVDPADLGRLYRQLDPRLRRIVRVGVCAPEHTIEDACQIAWWRLMRQAGRIDSRCALAWLVCTARREVMRHVERARREVSWEAALTAADEIDLAALVPTPEELVEMHERLGVLDALSARRRRLMWLAAAGLSYEEIATATGDSVRTVERQLTRARRELSIRAA